MADLSDYIRQHLKSYLETDGADGYERSAPGLGGPRVHLILKAIGRKSGAVHLTPLLFKPWGDDWAIVASKAGADQHPAWFLNLSAAKTVDVQIKDKRYRCTWRICEGDERAKVWRALADYYPPYDDYQAATPRLIPVVILQKLAELDERFSLGD
jgi:deazaflavin-dependent oxidoreductase (nitroreductase family)